MTEREQRNAIQAYNRQLEQYAKHLGTSSRQYQHLLTIGQTAGFTFGEKGDHVIASVGKNELSKMTEDIKRSIESVPKWEKTKEWYTKRLNLQGKKKEEQEKIMKEESEFYSNLQNTMDSLFNEVYAWEREHETIDSEYIIESYHENIAEAWHYTKEQFNEWVEKIREEMARGGTERKRTYEEMSGDVYNDLYGAEL